jgi:hypothetical protein
MRSLRGRCYSLSLHIRNSSTEQKYCALKCLLSVTLNCAFSFLSFVTLYGKLLKIMMPERMHFSESMIGWQLVYESCAYSLY